MSAGSASAERNKKSKPPASAGAMTPGNGTRMNNSMNEQYRASKAQQKNNMRLDNMDASHVPQNVNPLNIEIGPGGTSRVL